MNTLIKINFFLFTLLFLITSIKWANNYLQQNGIELLPDISDETVANKLKQIKQNLWQTSENRWI